MQEVRVLRLSILSVLRIYVAREMKTRLITHYVLERGLTAPRNAIQKPHALIYPFHNVGPLQVLQKVEIKTL
jgi:hypothetical protein